MTIRLTMVGVLLVSNFAMAAPLDPQPGQATKWSVLLRTPRHPLLDDRFHEQLSRELKAALQPGLGLLGAVEIIDLSKVTPTDATAKQFQAKGLVALDSNPTRPLNDHKLHGVNIEVKDGAFEISTKQLDGFTGLATPTRTRTVHSLDQIARTVGLLLEPDYAPAGTIEIIPTDPLHVMLVLRGHTLAPLEGRVKPGDVFAVSVIKEAAAQGMTTRTGTPVPYTFLKTVEPVKEGKVKCLILSRWASPFGRESRRAAGVRALRLSTMNSPLRVQLVDRAGKPHPRGNLTLTASDIDFSAKGDSFEFRDGLYKSTRPFATVACISVGVGSDAPQQFPVPVITDEIITLVFEVKPADELRAQFLRDCLDLRARIADLSTAQVAMVAAMNGMIDQAKNREALARAESGRETVSGSAKTLAEELKTLQSQDGAKDAVAKEVLEACERQITVVQQSQTQLSTTITTLKDAIGKASGPDKIEKELYGREIAGRIKEHLTRGDVPEALAEYDKLIATFPAEASYKDSREKLLAEWTPKDDAHRVARESIRTLAKAKSPGEFKAACVDIKKAVPVMKARKDRLGLRKLHNTFDPAIAAFHEILTRLDGQPVTAEKSAETAALDEILTDLRQCEIIVRTGLKEIGPEEKK